MARLWNYLRPTEGSPLPPLPKLLPCRDQLLDRDGRGEMAAYDRAVSVRVLVEIPDARLAQVCEIAL